MKYSTALQRQIPKFRNKQSQKRNKGISGSQSQFPPSCVCERFIYSHNRPGYSAGGNMQTDPRSLGLYKSLTETRMLKLGLRPRYSLKIARKLASRMQILAVLAATEGKFLEIFKMKGRPTQASSNQYCYFQAYTRYINISSSLLYSRGTVPFIWEKRM